MSRCCCQQCKCGIEGLHEHFDWICPFCKSGNHVTENKQSQA